MYIQYTGVNKTKFKINIRLYVLIIFTINDQHFISQNFMSYLLPPSILLKFPFIHHCI